MEVNSLALIITMVVSVLGSSIATVRLLMRQINHMEVRLTGQITASDTRLTGQITALDTRLTGQVTALDTRLTGQISSLDTRLTDQITALDTRLTGEVKELSGAVKELSGEVKEHGVELKEHGRRLDELSAQSRERGRVLGEVRDGLARVEGHLMAPGGFIPRRARPPSDEDSDGEHREAG